MTQEQVLVDCLERLNRENISYMLTGSMASNVWGLPRLTHDLDFVLHSAKTTSSTKRQCGPRTSRRINSMPSIYVPISRLISGC